MPGRTPNPVPFVVQPGYGTPVQAPIGGSTLMKAHTWNTNGALTVSELVVPPKQGPALHIHTREDEMWHVLEGHFRFKAGDALLRAPTGAFVFGPRGTPHCFQNVADTPGRLLAICTPSGVERFFEQYAELPDPGGPEAFAAIAHANWLEFVGPPPPWTGLTVRPSWFPLAASPEPHSSYRPAGAHLGHAPGDSSGQPRSTLDLSA